MFRGKGERPAVHSTQFLDRFIGSAREVIEFEWKRCRNRYSFTWRGIRGENQPVKTAGRVLLLTPAAATLIGQPEREMFRDGSGGISEPPLDCPVASSELLQVGLDDRKSCRLARRRGSKPLGNAQKLLMCRDISANSAAAE
ncbi:hypothetical protein [Planctomicrobium piriforme]|uniref:hypothetical protein n=1 Tax=Planctomicrobium piriforme TaxID=1576369 RepID=UPI0011142006|nr:hypothetical protein [Planctomicrobium piriforme]